VLHMVDERHVVCCCCCMHPSSRAEWSSAVGESYGSAMELVGPGMVRYGARAMQVCQGSHGRRWRWAVLGTPCDGLPIHPPPPPRVPSSHAYRSTHRCLTKPCNASGAENPWRRERLVAEAAAHRLPLAEAARGSGLPTMPAMG
jgi:hypothetical protein